jgi:hypothetical protein
MDDHPSPHNELDRLLMLVVEGELTPVDQQQLSDLLQSDTEARRYYVRYIELHAALQTKFVRPPVILPDHPPVSFHGLGGPSATQGSQPFGVAPIVWAVIAGLSGVVLAVVVGIVLLSRGGRLDQKQSDAQQPEVVQTLDSTSRLPEKADRSDGQDERREAASHPKPPTPGSESTISSVARLNRTKGCRWDGPHAPLTSGERLFAGQSLRLLAGVAEIGFDVGAKIILQGPATLDVESGTSARLSMGKATTEITSEAARGFKIDTPQATFVDQGTEFGVEVTPGGGSRIHVFRGQVDVAMNANGKAQVASQRLMANGGACLEGETPSMTLMEDTGESFIRSIDESGRDEHVIAYWRFEDQPLGMLLPDTRDETRRVRATTDSSFNGNDLFTFSTASQPYFTGDVPATIVPQTAAVNRGCLNNSEPPVGHAPTRDVYTLSQFSHASPLDIQKITPAAWTIEASVTAAKLQRGCQTFVVRDGTFHAGKPLPPRLAFQITAEDRFAVRFIDVDNRTHEAVAVDLALQENHWYHTAATSDGRNLRLYVDILDGRGYQLRATRALPQSGSTALGKSTDTCSWSIGRGKRGRNPAEWFQGCIDEVRISDVALAPSRFLFAPGASREPHKESIDFIGSGD